jgi:CheY-like chemotaxis protein
MEQCAKLFQPFNQADVSTSRKFGGTGLGLSISKRLVEMMGGSIGVTSSIGNGSTFYFTLPLHAATKSILQRHPANLSGMRSLIVNNRISSTDALEITLRSWSFEVCHAHSAEEGLEKIHEAEHSGRPFELLLIDINVPKLGGVELTRKIRSEQAQKILGRSPIAIMVNALDREALVKTAIDIHFDAIIEKPITPSSLLDTIISLQSIEPDNIAPPLLTVKQSLFKMTHTIHGAHVLLVEDNPTNQLVAQGILEQMGLLIDIANDGIEAIELVNKNQYDIVLMDLQMPRMDGFEATSQIRALTQGDSLPIIAMTASAMVSDKQAATAAGMNAHVSKPIDSQELASVLLQWVKPNSEMPIEQEMEQPKNKITETEFHLEGLDLTNAVNKMDGNWYMLRKILLGFSRDFANATDLLNTHLASGNLQDAARLVHTVKGLAPSIGAVELGHLAVSLEEELRTGSQTSLNNFCTLLTSVLNAISTLQETTTSAIKATPLDTSQISSLMQELLLILESAEIVPYKLQENLNIALSSYTKPEQVEALLQQIVNLDYASAKQSLRQINTNIGINLHKR